MRSSSGRLAALALLARYRSKRHGGGPPPAAASTTYAFDEFNRANGPIGNADSGQAWTDAAGVWTTNGNTAKVTGVSGTRVASIDTGQADGWFRVTLTVNGGAGVMMRRIDDSNFLWTRVTAGILKLVRTTANVKTSIGSGTAVSDGDQIAVNAVGSSFKVYKNGALDITVTETQGQTATSCGLATDVSAATLDSWSHKST